MADETNTETTIAAQIEQESTQAEPTEQRAAGDARLSQLETSIASLTQLVQQVLTAKAAEPAPAAAAPTAAPSLEALQAKVEYMERDRQYQTLIGTQNVPVAMHDLVLEAAHARKLSGADAAVFFAKYKGSAAPGTTTTPPAQQPVVQLPTAKADARSTIDPSDLLKTDPSVFRSLDRAEKLSLWSAYKRTRGLTSDLFARKPKPRT